MKFTIIEIKGKEYNLVYNGFAMFALKEFYADGINDALNANTMESYEFVCHAVAIMSEQGELARRYLGYDKADFISYDAIKECSVIWSPLDAIRIKTAVIQAITRGYEREVKPDEGKEIDEGLAELDKKKAKKPRKPTT